MNTMNSRGIHSVKVEYLETADQPRPRRAMIRFQGGCEIAVEYCGRGVQVRLSTPHQSVMLLEEAPSGDFCRAVNLLRLHIPDRRPGV